MAVSHEFAAILLAAGSASRFGEAKLVHPMPDGVAIAAHAARNLRAAGLAVTAVVRPGDERLSALLAAEGCAVAACPDAGGGMGHSLAHGVRATTGAPGWVVALADMPAVRPETIRRVCEALRAGASIAAPVYRGERGHPVAFAARHGAALAGLSGDAGARAILQAHRAELILVECDDAGVLYDIDRKADIRRPV